MKSPITFLQGIVTIIILSILGLIILIIFSGKMKFGMVNANYYEKDLQYQDQINRIKRTADLKESVQIEIVGTNISINFPELFEYKSVTGEIKLYRPSDPSMDRNLIISLDTNGQQLIKTDNLKSGAWKIQITWYYDDLGYYTEKGIFISN
jgi:nitrogen fixation protein FixH